jgi:molybdopterin converting factor subunit 1
VRITVLYFAVFRERVGRSDEIVELADGTTVGAAIAMLGTTHASIAKLAGRFRVAVNQDFADDDTRVLRDGDELALIPPVAGGNGRHVVLTDQPLSLDRCIAAVSAPGIGGIVTFTGMVRANSHGVAIDRLEYEAYGPMAVRTMIALCDEIEAELPGVAIAVEHRVGRLEIGELAVAIAAAAPHRAEAFTACRAMIDRLKDRVPIWKKEFGETGETWVGLGP